MDNAVIYARVSSKGQEVEGFSIPAQRKMLQEYAHKNGLAVIQEFTDVETAKKAGRTQFNKMLSFLHDNKHIKNILVEKTDRLLRNIADYAVIDRLVEHSEITIHLVK
jgi:site-specific DNA recombinase